MCLVVKRLVFSLTTEATRLSRYSMDCPKTDIIFTPRRYIMPGQPQLGDPTFGIDCTKLDVLDTGGVSNLILEADTDFRVRTRFEISGFLANWVSHWGPEYKVTYYYEGMGGAPEGTLAEVEAALIDDQLVYEDETTATAKLTKEGTYKLTVVVKFKFGDITAFMEGPIIQVFIKHV